MAAFDALVRVTGFGVNLAENEQGKKTEAQVAVQIATMIPVGPNQAAPLPIGQLRLPFDKQSVKALIESLTEAYNDMDDLPRSDLIVAGGQTDVDRAAQELQGFRG